MSTRADDATPAERIDGAGRILYGVGTSRTMRAHWTLQELGLAYETRPILSRSGETQTPAFLALNPRGKIPLLVDGDLVLAESGAIAAYLADTYEPGALAPRPGSRERAIHDQWCWFILMELDATSLYVVRRHQGLPQIYGAAPAAVDASLAYFRKQLAVAAAELARGGPYLLGDTFTLADIHLATCSSWAKMLAEPLPEPTLIHLERAMGRSAAKTATATNFPPEALAAIRQKPTSGDA